MHARSVADRVEDRLARPPPQVVGQKIEPLFDPVDEAIGIRNTVTRDIVPDLVDVGLGEWRDDYPRHAAACRRRSRPRRFVSWASNGSPSPIQLLDGGIEQSQQGIADRQDTAATRRRRPRPQKRNALRPPARGEELRSLAESANWSSRCLRDLETGDDKVLALLLSSCPSILCSKLHAACIPLCSGYEGPLHEHGPWRHEPGWQRLRLAEGRELRQGNTILLRKAAKVARLPEAPRDFKAPLSASKVLGRTIDRFRVLALSGGRLDIAQDAPQRNFATGCVVVGWAMMGERINVHRDAKPEVTLHRFENVCLHRPERDLARVPRRSRQQSFKWRLGTGAHTARRPSLTFQSRGWP